MDEQTIEAALDVCFDSDAGEGLTVREYLHALLYTLWEKQEGFSGKRPFGNSSWALELYAPLINAGYITGKLDEDGYVLQYDSEEAWHFVASLIDAAMGFEYD